MFQCFKNAMSHVGISDWETKIIGFGCDGTNANIAAAKVNCSVLQQEWDDIVDYAK